VNLKKFIKFFLYKYFSKIFHLLDYYINIVKINKLKLHHFNINEVLFSMFATPNFIDPSWQKKETDVIAKILKNNEIFINLGANYGFYVCLAAKFKNKIIAVEPDFFNLKVLYRNIQLNKIEDCIVIPMATYDKNSLMPIYGGGVTASLSSGWDNTTKSDEKSLVPTFKFENLIKEKYFNKKTLILMDIENSEYKTLLGSTEILQSDNKPCWIVEIHPIFYSREKKSSEEFDKIFRLFWENGYFSYLIADNGLIKVDLNNYDKKHPATVKHNRNYIFIDKNNLESFSDIF
jgi:FkbM family methyltransferase